MSESFARETLNQIKKKLGMSDDLDELTKAEQRGYANAMEAERKLHEDRIEQLERERDELRSSMGKAFRFADDTEAKLAKAVECLQWIMNHRGECFIPEPWDDMANDLLAELEGEPLGAEFEAVWDANKGELYQE